jgi:L-aminopeptidase/D-esterase-like protein
MSEHTNSLTDVPGIRVGHWTDPSACTGCTVVLCEQGAVAGVDVRGAAPGTRETDLLRPGNLVEQVHAILLSGGSAFGLDAASGVMRYLEQRNVGFPMGDLRIPIVPAAILMDLRLGRSRVRPTAAAGYAACLDATTGPVAQGSVGAGTGATVAKCLGMEHAVKGGLGTASERSDTGIIAGALIAVNAAGDVIDPRNGQVVAGPRGRPGEFLNSVEILSRGVERVADAPANTTIGVVATNARLTKEQANRLATVAHDGLARSIRPVHTRGDGDVLFALATGGIEIDAAGWRALEVLACLTVERAVINAIAYASGLGGVPSAAEWKATTPTFDC